MRMFGRELTLEQTIGFVRCNAAPNEDLVHMAALELIAALQDAQRREQAAVVDMERMANSSPIGRCIFCKHEHDEDCKHGGKCFKWRGNILRR